MCLGSGTLLDFAVAPYEGKETGEQALLRRLLFNLRVDDILLGDANFENYFLLALLFQAKADVVFEKNGARIVTTLLDAEEYSRTEIIALYLKRWHVETDFDVIKTTMKMDMLRCKSPEMVRK